jgi:hypothetical protein
MTSPQVGASKVSTQFRFTVDPHEDQSVREARWDQMLSVLHGAGRTVAGVGPDGDWPVHIEYPDGETIDNTTHPIDGPFVEVYGTKKLVVR